MPSSFYDVVIVGGGLVGSAMACSIGTNQRLNTRVKVLLLESGRHTKETSTDDQYSNRVSAISPTSTKMFQSFGIWADIQSTNRVKPVSDLYIEDGCADSRIQFKKIDEHSPIAHIVENQLIINALYKCITENCVNVRIEQGVTVDSFNIPENLYETVKIQLNGGQDIETPLLIAADGAKSKVRAMAGMEFVETDYQQMSIVGTLEIEDKGNGNPIAWQRFMPLGPVALLPLTDRLSSLVWTTSAVEARRLLELPSDLFIDELNRILSDNSAHHQSVNRSLDLFGKFLNCLPSGEEKPSDLSFPYVISMPFDDRAAFPLSFGYANDYVRSRVALIGDAAHRVHPLAGQGVNLGWSDVRFLTNALEKAISEGGDLGSLTYLREFDTASQRRNVPVMVAIDWLNRLYSSDSGPLVLLRSLGFNTLDKFLPAKDLIVHLAS